MKKYLFTQRSFSVVGLTLFIFSSLFSSAQNPLVKMWDKRFGGLDDDGIYSFQQTADGGFILGGYSLSLATGDKTQPTWGNEDYWIVKLDSLGNKQWDKDFGGSGSDVLNILQQTYDGGYILGGYSNSGVSGDKSQNTMGGYDYWVVKVDSVGIKQWDKDFGSITSHDLLYSLSQSLDGGYLLGGISASGVSGDKTEPSWGLWDYWIVKIDSLGNKEWDKDFGGTGEDDLYSIEQTNDLGFILGGSSQSSIGGDKTQVSQGFNDYWIVKIDSLGNKQWDKDFGGLYGDALYSLKQTFDQGYILGGYSNSGIGGDKSQPNWGTIGTDGDFWIVKTDSIGNKLWDKDYGGNGNEEFYQILQSYDGGYFLVGDSYSPISGDKSENNLGQEQTWVIKTDSIGIKQWDQTAFTNGHDEHSLAIETRDGCYAIANSENGVIGGYKTQWAWNGSPDFWIVKFCDSTILQSLFTAPTFLCPGTCINFTNLTFNATSYQWNFFGASPDTSTEVNPQNICYATPGSYDVQLIATNANGSDTLTLANYITVYPTPPPQSITQNGDTLFAIAGATSYQWYYNTNILNGATNYFYVAPASGDYNVVATDANGCEVEAAVFNVVAGLTPTLSKGEGVTAAPNPVMDKLFLTSSSSIEKAEIRIYNLLGETVLAVSPLSFGEGSGGEADVRTLPQGMYYLEINSGEKVFRAKFVKQ